MIIHIVTQEEPGGAQHLAVRLCRAHRACGVAAETWFLYRKERAFVDEPGMRTLRESRPGPFALPGLLRQLRSELQRSRPTAVVAHTHWANLLVPPVARAAGVAIRPAVIHCPPSAMPWAARWSERLALMHRATTAWVAISPAIGRECRSLFAPRLIPNAVPAPRPGDGPAMRARLGLAADVPLAVAVGRLATQKGQVDLVGLLARRPELHVAIAGEGPLRGELTELAARQGVAARFHLLGALDAAAVSDLLAAGDLFVMPSRFEGLSLALLEACHAGKPVVASDVDGNRDALGVGADAAGILVPPGDVPALADAVGAVLGDPACRTRLAVRAREQAGRFSETAMLDAWHRLLGVGA